MAARAAVSSVIRVGAVPQALADRAHKRVVHSRPNKNINCVINPQNKSLSTTAKRSDGHLMNPRARASGGTHASTRGDSSVPIGRQPLQ